jgi:hypothetical protein
MISLLATKLQPTNILFISWPMIEKWLPLGIPGALNWEHTYFCSIDVLKKLFNKRGFKIVDEQNFFNDHSMFMALKREDSQTVVELHGDIQQNRKLVSEYFHCFVRQVDYVKKLIIDSPQPIWMMPASVYTQYPYVFGLNKYKIEGILDNSPSKLGQRLYGTALRVISPSELNNQVIGTVILNAGAHSKEIIQQLVLSHPGIQIINIQDFTG